MKHYKKELLNEFVRVRFPKTLKKELNKIAKKEYTTIAEVIRRIVVKEVKRREK